MTDSIVRYIEYLRKECGLEITVHNRGLRLGGLMRCLVPYNIHYNPYCLYVKSSKTVWDACIKRQCKVYEKGADGTFFGCCYAGVSEFVVPIVYKKDMLGFISVSGYKGNADKMRHFAEKYGLDKRQTELCFHQHLKTEIPDQEWVETLIMPLAAMLALYHAQMPEFAADASGEYIFSHALSYIHFHFNEKICLADVAAACHCSPSYISRLFHKKSGQTIQNYIRSCRIAEAKRLLEQTDFPLSEIAFMAGFTDSNYFSNCFRKETGQAPSAYRRAVEKRKG